MADPVLVTVGEETRSISGWARFHGISNQAMRARRQRGWTLLESCTYGRYERPPRLVEKRKKKRRHRKGAPLYRYGGKDYSLTELAEIAPVSLGTLRARLQKGYSVRAAMFLPLGTVRRSQIKKRKHGSK